MLAACPIPWATQISSSIDTGCSQHHQATFGKIFYLVGEAYEVIPPHMMSSVDAAAEQAIAVKDCLEGNITAEVFWQWVLEATVRRHVTSEYAGQVGMGKSVDFVGRYPEI
jgi:hypothetical protein